MFENKFQNHKYRNEILIKFENETPIQEIIDYLKEKGTRYILCGDTLRRHKKKHLESLAIEEELEKTKEDLGEPSQDIEGYLLETIAQCRTRKRSTTITGKDFQYYDQQMQSAIKLLSEIRGSEGKSSMSLEDVFAKLSEGINVNEGTDTAGTDYKVS